MATSTTRQNTSQPVLECWMRAKDLDNSQKIELVQMLLDSVKPAVANTFGQEEEKYSLKPYTMEEINAMLDEAEANFAAGRGIPSEEVWREIHEELEREEAEEAGRYTTSYYYEEPRRKAV
ncbi:MAG: hypothetical protein IJS63_04965 [Bacteroidaceae bacterium]|nr:hypothetical protein [Bacteroidaceae bacterium]